MRERHRHAEPMHLNSMPEELRRIMREIGFFYTGYARFADIERKFYVRFSSLNQGRDIGFDHTEWQGDITNNEFAVIRPTHLAEDICTFLRLWNYPVDAILRTKRLAALLDDNG